MSGAAPRCSRRALLGACAGALALAACREGTPRPPAELRIATGPPGAVFRELGAALAAVLAERFPDTRVRAIPTGASVENLRLLADGRTELALASLDATVAGLASRVPPTATAVARLYDSFLQVVVRADGPVHRLADLTGRTASQGAAGSGTEFITGRLLSLPSIKDTVRPRLITMDQASSAAALADRRIDAFFTLTGVPTPAITTLQRKAELRLLPLDAYVDEMNTTFGQHYTPGIIAASVYPPLPPVATMAVANLLLVQPSMAADVVTSITRALFDQRPRIARGHPEANRINVRTGIATSPLPLHPGAARYYRSVKP